MSAIQLTTTYSAYAADTLHPYSLCRRPGDLPGAMPTGNTGCCGDGTLCTSPDHYCSTDTSTGGSALTSTCVPIPNRKTPMTHSKQQSKKSQTPVVGKVTQAHPSGTTVAAPKTTNKCAGLTGATLTACQNGTSTQLPVPTPAHPCAGLTGSNLTRCLDANKAINTASQNIPSSFVNRKKPLNVKVSGGDAKPKTSSGANIPVMIQNPPPITHGHPQHKPYIHPAQQDPTTLPLCPTEGDFDKTKCYTPPPVVNPSTRALEPMNDPTAQIYQKTGGITAGGQTKAPGTGFGFLNQILSNPMYLLIGGVLIYFLFFYHGKHHRR